MFKQYVYVKDLDYLDTTSVSNPISEPAELPHS